MMKVQLKVGPKAIVEADGETLKQVFERVAVLAEVFAQTEKCGACGGTNVVPQVRQPQGFTYYEMACLACGARLTFGQAKEGGGLFAKTTGKENGGWEKWEGSQEAPRAKW